MSSAVSSAPLVSVIIPTYNRPASLRCALQSVVQVEFPPHLFEVVVVDNNPSDETPQVAGEFRESRYSIQYVKETRLSFTVARHTGASAARGSILVYIDDDVIVDPGWLAAVANVFEHDEAVGIVGGPILPIFEGELPDWIKKRHMMTGWLSLLDLGSELHESHKAFGPNFSVRKDVLSKVGGFPADTIGVEAEGRPGTIEKIYVGDGDVGLCRKVEAAGYKVMYAPRALVHHVIPPVRLTKQWWRSRFAGEACLHALMTQRDERETARRLLVRSLRSIKRGVGNFLHLVTARLKGEGGEDWEFWAAYYLSRARVEFALARYPELADRLWEMALTGVPPQDLRKLHKILP